MAEQTQFITLPYKLERAAPPFEANAVKYPESLVRYFLDRHTSPGQRVFDPFAGLGTTLFVAEDMKRVPYGIEADGQRHPWVAGQLRHWRNLVHGDAGKLSTFGFPKMDFAMTSPPFMKKGDRWNPLYGGSPKYNGYDAYLKQMGCIFGQLADIMKRNATVIVQADNLTGKTYTPLVRDLSLTIEPHLRLDAEIIVSWKGGKPHYRHTHCLVFKNT